MSKDNDSRTIFTFRVASDEIKRVGTQLSGLTSQAKAVGDAIDSVQASIDKKRKELRLMAKRIDSKRKLLVRISKKADKGMDLLLYIVVQSSVDTRAAAYDMASRAKTESMVQSTDGIFETTFVRIIASPCSTSYIDSLTSCQAVEEASMVLSEMLPSPRKRKRFAGVWDGVDVDLPGPNIEKRARVDISAYESEELKENIAPSMSDDLASSTALAE